MRNTADSDPADTESTEMELPVLDLKKKKKDVVWACLRVNVCNSIFKNALALTGSCVFPYGHAKPNILLQTVTVFTKQQHTSPNPNTNILQTYFSLTHLHTTTYFPQHSILP